jgi:pyruvate dehydrogenase E2 component (dihydrolipoamide acetyltransferase)
MATEVPLPALGESVTEGTVTRWLKQVGDTVAVDEALLEVSTDKVDTEIPSPVSGVVLEIRAPEDTTVEVGAVLAVVGESDQTPLATAASPSHDPLETASPGVPGTSVSETSWPPVGATTTFEPEPVFTESSSALAEPVGSFGISAAAAPPSESPMTDPLTNPASSPVTNPVTNPASETATDADTNPGAPAEATSQTSVVLPALGESVTEGTVTRWLKKLGDSVAVDEPLLEVSTDKVDTEIPSPVAGTLVSITASEDQTVGVGEELGVLAVDSATATPSATIAPSEQPAAPPTPVTQQAPLTPLTPVVEAPAPEPTGEPEEATVAEPPSAIDGPQSYVTPLVRKLAAQHGVQLSSIVGTGVGGRIRKQDVIDAAKAAEAAAAAAAAQAAQSAVAPAVTSATGPGTASASTATTSASVATTAESPLRGTTESMSRLRKVIAQRMVESLHSAAQLTSVVEVDVTSVARLRDKVKADFAAREGVKLSFLPFFAKAAVDALKQHPVINATIDTEKGEITYFDKENLSLAVDTERGLLTPVIKDAGDLSVAGLARKIADIAERTRTNKITPDDLSGGTFTLTNTGSRGALFDTPILNLPQAAILGTGTVVKRAVVIDDPHLGETIAVRHMVYLSLTYDHRLVDGADAARFLTEVKARLESGIFEV